MAAWQSAAAVASSPSALLYSLSIAASGIGAFARAFVTAAASFEHACFISRNCRTSCVINTSPSSADTTARALPPCPPSHAATLAGWDGFKAALESCPTAWLGGQGGGRAPPFPPRREAGGAGGAPQVAPP